MTNDTFTHLTAFVAYGQCFSFKDAVKFVKEEEQRDELTEKELETIRSIYEHYRHFGF